MAGQSPGPICSSRVGDNWIDLGTTCRTLTDKPGITDIAAAMARMALERVSLVKQKFDQDHVYSLAPPAARKRDIDLQIVSDDYSRSSEISIANEAYLKELIKIASGEKITVSGSAKRMQFFYIKGGGEGFLPATMANVNASRVVQPGSTTHSGSSEFIYEFTFEENDLLAVFDKHGKLIRAARLERPVSILDKTLPSNSEANVFRESTGESIYNSWDKKDVLIYRNSGRFSVPYLGLHVDAGAWIVDFHKQEDTNGCIFIVDPATPPLNTKELNTFEPKLITDILASIGKTPAQVKGITSLGTIRLIDI
jgi:hypothetical protein